MKKGGGRRADGGAAMATEITIESLGLQTQREARSAARAAYDFGSCLSPVLSLTERHDGRFDVGSFATGLERDAAVSNMERYGNMSGVTDYDVHRTLGALILAREFKCVSMVLDTIDRPLRLNAVDNLPLLIDSNTTLLALFLGGQVAYPLTVLDKDGNGLLRRAVRRDDTQAVFRLCSSTHVSTEVFSAVAPDAKYIPCTNPHIAAILFRRKVTFEACRIRYRDPPLPRNKFAHHDASFAVYKTSAWGCMPLIVAISNQFDDKLVQAIIHRDPAAVHRHTNMMILPLALAVYLARKSMLPLLLAAGADKDEECADPRDVRRRTTASILCREMRCSRATQDQ